MDYSHGKEEDSKHLQSHLQGSDRLFGRHTDRQTGLPAAARKGGTQVTPRCPAGAASGKDTSEEGLAAEWTRGFVARGKPFVLEEEGFKCKNTF